MNRLRQGGWTALRPLPSRLWARWAPSTWPAPEEPWTDLARAGLGGAASAALERMPGALPATPEVLFFPPVVAAREGERVELAEGAIAAGHAVLWLGSPAGVRAPRGAVEVLDLLPSLLQGSWPVPGEIAGVSVALWPVAGGFAEVEGPMGLGVGLDLLAGAGVSAVLGVPLELAPSDRRRLAELGGERLFDRIFHAEPPDLRPLARETRRHGLAWGIPRPVVALRPDRARNRDLAGLLALAAELWLAAGRPEAAGAELWRAAREAEGFSRDLGALAREGRLDLLPWLAGPARQLAEDWSTGRSAAWIRELETEWLRPEPE